MTQIQKHPDRHDRFHYAWRYWRPTHVNNFALKNSSRGFMRKFRSTFATSNVCLSHCSIAIHPLTLKLYREFRSPSQKSPLPPTVSKPPHPSPTATATTAKTSPSFCALILPQAQGTNSPLLNHISRLLSLKCSRSGDQNAHPACKIVGSSRSPPRVSMSGICEIALPWVDFSLIRVCGINRV